MVTGVCNKRVFETTLRDEILTKSIIFPHNFKAEVLQKYSNAIVANKELHIKDA